MCNLTATDGTVTAFQWNGQVLESNGGEEMTEIDHKQVNLETQMRESRDAYVRYLQEKNTKAALMRMGAQHLEEQVAYGFTQVNEDVPVPADRPYEGSQ